MNDNLRPDTVVGEDNLVVAFCVLVNASHLICNW